MIGVLYYINKDEYILYHPIIGFQVIETIKDIDKNIIWITNLKDIELNYLKREDFFNIKFKEIIYFFNVDKLNAPEQFKVIVKLFNSIIEIFKEEYSFLNLKVEDLNKVNNFSELLFKSNIDSNLLKIDFPYINVVSQCFNKEIEFDNINNNNFFISYFDSYDFIKSLFEINFPIGDFDIYDIDGLSKNKDPFVVMSSIPKDSCFFMNCEVIDSDFVKKYFPEKDRNSWFSNIELLFLKNKCELKLNKIIIFKDSFKLKNFIRTRFKSKYLNFAFEIFTLNIIKSIKNNNIKLINLWLESYEKTYFLGKSLPLIEENIEIGYFNGNKILISIEDIKQVDILENNNLMYPIKLVRYILNN